MTTFTLKSFARAAAEMEKLEQALPAATMKGLAEAGKQLLIDASSSSGGVKAREDQFSLRLPKKANGYASQAIVGKGFAVLDEYGSYKKPGGWDIDPGFAFNAAKGTAKQGRVLADGKGFFAAYVHHPPLKAHPFVGKAEAALQVIANHAYDTAQTVALKKAFR